MALLRRNVRVDPLSFGVAIFVRNTNLTIIDQSLA